MSVDSSDLYPLAPFREVTRYSFCKELFSDSTTEVYEATERVKVGSKFTKRLVSLKIKPEKQDENERREAYARFLQTTDSPHVVKCFNSFYTRYRNDVLEYWSVFEYCSFTSLDNYWKENAIIQQDQNRFFISDIAVGLEYIYQTLKKQHLHLYPCNVLLTKDPASVFPKAKLTNFALCDKLDENDTTMPKDVTICDINYAAPEYLDGYSTNTSDVWSLGIIIFKLVVGRIPFELIEIDPYSALFSRVDINLDIVDDECARSLLRKMLCYEPSQRISLSQVFTDPFIKQCKDHKYGKLGDKNNYRALKQIDHGKFGQVFTAETKDGTVVAIKEISGDEREIRREATCMRLCKHPHLVEYKDVFVSNESMIKRLNGNNEIGSFAYLVMEYCDAGSLEKYMRDKKGPLSNEECLFFLGDIASGLWYLHFHKRFIHRDLKPANLLLKTTSFKYPRIKIADYGFSRGISSLMGSCVGTPIYEAPEIINNVPYTSKSDLYSLGVILYQMATNTFPFSDDPAVFYVAMRNEEPVYFPSNIAIDPNFKDLILHLVTHHEHSRLSWQEFYKHPYVKEALRVSSNLQPTDDEFGDLGYF